MGHPEGMGTPEPAESAEHKIKSKYIWREEGVPDDAATLEALREWADAWGEYVWQCKIENQPVPPNEDEASADLKAKGDVLETKGAALEKLLPSPEFFDGVVTWNGGNVQLTT